MLRGDLGYSYFYGQPAIELVFERLPPELFLVTYAIVLTIIISVPLAIWAAVRRDGIADAIVRVVIVFGLSLPPYWIGILLLLLFGIWWPIFPVGGYGSTLGEQFRALFLPSLTLAFGLTPLVVRSLRASLIEALEADHVDMARSKGVIERVVFLRHAFRLALIPAVTILGLHIGLLIGATLIVEFVFAVPGLGQLMLTAISTRDYPTVVAVTLVFAVFVMVVNLLTDLLVAVLDPRARAAMVAAPMSTDVLERPGFLDWLTRLPASLVVGILMIISMIVVAVVGPWLTLDPLDLNLRAALQPPSTEHWLGTDNYGRDVFARIIHATAVDLQFGFFSVVPTFVMGTALGVLAGTSRWFDAILMRLVDLVVAFPFYVLIIAIVATLGPGVTNMFIAVMIVGWASYARLVRNEVLVIGSHQYVEAARVLGFSSLRVLRRHVLPNVIVQPVLLATTNFTAWILIGSALGFLGLGVQPPAPEWGVMIGEGRNFLGQAPWMAIFPGIAIFYVCFAAILVGDGLSDVLQPEVA